MGSTDLVNQAIQGDREAFIRLIRDIENSLYNTAKSMLRKEEDVADAIQETILNAYKSVHTLREPRYFKTWLFRILINECNTMLSRRSLSTAYAEVPSEKREHSSPYDEVDMREAVDRLEESKRIVVVLHYFEDLSLRQVARCPQYFRKCSENETYSGKAGVISEIQKFSGGKLTCQTRLISIRN